ncbi:hypothetical protein ACU4GD_46090 [Cupriavidus basilensis]
MKSLATFCGVVGRRSADRASVAFGVDYLHPSRPSYDFNSAMEQRAAGELRGDGEYHHRLRLKSGRSSAPAVVIGEDDLAEPRRS